MKNISKILMGCLMALGSSSIAANSSYNTGYVQITEIKVWRSVIDVYSETVHACSDQTHNRRLLLDKTEKEMYTLALAAMTTGKGANINYVCDSGGIPRVNGIRVRQ